MKIRPLFDKYQKYLVAFCNTRLGRAYLKTVGEVLNLPIVKVAPDGIHYLVGFKDKKCTKPILRAVFYSRSPYIKKFELALTTIEAASNSFDFLRWIDKPELAQFVIPHFQGLDMTRMLPSVMLATSTIYPDANPEVTSVDGNIDEYNSGTGDTFANFRAGTGGTLTALPSGNGDYYVAGYLETRAVTDKYNEMDRSFYLFDTSSLGAGAVVSAATFSFYGVPTGNFTLGTSGQRALALVGTTPASNTNLATSDWNNIGATRYATDLADTSYTDSGYNDRTLNATGIAAVAVAGITKLGQRLAMDADNTAPTWSGTKNTAYGSRFSDYGSNKPKLVVTYTAPPSAGNPLFFSTGVAIG